MSWIDDEVSDPEPDTAPVESGERSDTATDESFEKQLQAIVAAGNSTISLDLIEDNIEKVTDADLLERTISHVDDDEKQELVERQLESIVDEEDEGGDESDGSEETVESVEEFDNLVREAVLDGYVDQIPVEYIESFGSDLDTEVIERAIEESDTDEVTEAFQAAKPEPDDTDDSVFSESSLEDESAPSEAEEIDESDGTDLTEEIDSTRTVDAKSASKQSDEADDWRSSFNEAASSAGGVSVEEAAEMENRWSMLVWSEPGKGKTHFGYSTKEPVCIIDTEGKAHHLSDKFRDKTVRVFQPSDFDEALDALHDALDILETVYENTGRIGTIVVDSMSIMWEWSQQKYVDKFYRGKDVDEVEFSSAIGSGGKSDWKQIKRYHNVQFRQTIIDSPFHFVWTAMSGDDYEAAIENDINYTPKKPSGEKDNEYKASEVLRLRENEEGVTVGELEKSDKVDHHYTGLKKPDFPKHQKVVRAIRDAESGKRSVQSVESEFDVEVFEGNPRTARIAEEK